MIELSSAESIMKENLNNGSHSLPEYWNTQRIRIQTNTFPCETIKPPSLSAVLIASSTESSDDYDD